MSDFYNSRRRNKCWIEGYEHKFPTPYVGLVMDVHYAKLQDDQESINETISTALLGDYFFDMPPNGIAGLIYAAQKN